MKDIVGGHKVKRETRIEKIFNQDYNAGKAFKTIVQITNIAWNLGWLQYIQNNALIYDICIR